MPEEKLEETLNAIGSRIRPELARLGSLPEELREAVIQMLPVGTRTAMEVLGLVEAEPETDYGVRILRLCALGNAVIDRLAGEERVGDGSAVPIEKILEPVGGPIHQAGESVEESDREETATDSLIPVDVRLGDPHKKVGAKMTSGRGVEWQQLVGEGPIPVAVEVGGAGAATVAHLIIEVALSTVKVWQQSGKVGVIDAATRQPLPRRGNPLVIDVGAESGNPMEVFASRLAVDIRRNPSR
ncbi:hypothetical protein [Streptomyces platensis]|uniref:hypothetical protein n=1 Tax=Streptomyces platensis TaxID=58346 RepID=UPI003321000E